MELKFIEIFYRVVEERGFSNAANALFLTQPTISSHIKTLEDEVGLQLLDRLGRDVVPTKAGEVLYKYAKEIINLKTGALQAISEFKGTIKGKLMIGGSTIPGEYILPEYIAKFKNSHPEITVSLKIGDTQKITDMVSDGSVEIAVVGAKPDNERFDCRQFLEDKIVLAASQKHFKHIKKEIDINEFKKLPLVIREKGSGTQRSVEGYLKRQGVNPDELNIAAEVSSTEGLKQSVKTGMGAAFLSRFAIKEVVPCKTLREITVKGLEIPRHFYIITNKARVLSPICQSFIKTLWNPPDKLKIL
ncbi:MAG: LysR family transcriptional regulator [Deltaproteobacteria bacterium]|nr:LysR family transcriptional regulator [Deltaproteobacteria bacterium]